MTVRLELGDCVEVMRRLRRENVLVDAAVTDAPYHLASIVQRLGSPTAAPIQSGATGVYARSSTGFMGQTWDGGDVAFQPETWRALFDVLKPGAYLVAFGGTRTFHRMVCAIEDAGFEIRDQIAWLYGTGFPKSHDAGDGRGTALKPALEPICLAQKPSGMSVRETLALSGVGALGIDACRVPAEGEKFGGGQSKNGVRPGTHHEGFRRPWMNDPEAVAAHRDRLRANEVKAERLGRWPANVVHDGSDEVLAAFPRTESGTGAVKQASAAGYRGAALGTESRPAGTPMISYGDSGSAARFFYSAKATEGERIFRCRQCGIHQLGKPGCGHVDERGNPDLTSHPTVKPIALMRWLVRLICPAGGLVLDPFAGTGTTGAAAELEGRHALLIERERDYAADICIRLGLPLEQLAAAEVAPLPSTLDDLGPLFGGAAA